VNLFQDIIEFIKSILDVSIITLGKSHLTLGSILIVVVLLTLLITLSAKLKNWLVSLLVAQRGVEIGTGQAIGSIIRYTIIAIGFVIILQSNGVDLSSLTVLAGALGIGVGFGLQNIVGNIVSGFIILFERPIKVGDRIEIGTITGDVLKISLRATVVRTNDNIDIIVPNSEFISSKVINWSYVDRDVRFGIPVGVSYDADPLAVIRILSDVAAEHPGVLKMPEPEVIFEEFGDSSLNFVLRVWTHDYIARPLSLRSELNLSINRKFKEAEIEIPYPQRVVHIKSGTIELKPPAS
jgi:small-conductance mechanosensitive channel